MIINQWVPAAHRGDAIGDSARRVRQMLRRAGHRVRHLRAHDRRRRSRRRPALLRSGRGAGRRDDLSLRAAVADDVGFRLAVGARVLQYHNITPAAFFAPYDAQLFRLAALGRQELQSLVGRVDLALGDSEFNRQELEALGFSRTGVLPIAVNTERHHRGAAHVRRSRRFSATA